MEPTKITGNELILYATLFNIGLGILFGAVPLILGLIRKERSYAVFGFLGAIIGGAIMGILLSVPVAAIFTWLILRKPKNAATTNENPAGSSIGDSDNL